MQPDSKTQPDLALDARVAERVLGWALEMAQGILAKELTSEVYGNARQIVNETAGQTYADLKRELHDLRKRLALDPVWDPRRCPSCRDHTRIYPLNFFRWFCPTCSLSFVPHAIGGRPSKSDGVVRQAPHWRWDGESWVAS